MKANPDTGSWPKTKVISYSRSSLAWMVNDARAARAIRANVGSMILAVCIIDNFAIRAVGGWAGAHKAHLSFTDCADQFIERNLPSYHEIEDFYKNLRSRLIHSYGAIGFEFVDDPTLHLEVRQGATFICIDTFIFDVESGVRSYLSNLEALDEETPEYQSFRAAFDECIMRGPTRPTIP